VQAEQWRQAVFMADFTVVVAGPVVGTVKSVKTFEALSG
jgi:hypothetical protein